MCEGRKASCELEFTVLVSGWSDNGWLSGGHAVRMAMELCKKLFLSMYTDPEPLRRQRCTRLGLSYLRG